MASWTKEAMRLAGVDVNIFSPHSTRAASTSKANLSGTVRLGTILKAAGWKNARTFAKFYNKPIVDEGWSASSLQ